MICRDAWVNKANLQHNDTTRPFYCGVLGQDNQCLMQWLAKNERRLELTPTIKLIIFYLIVKLVFYKIFEVNKYRQSLTLCMQRIRPRKQRVRLPSLQSQHKGDLNKDVKCQKS